MSEICELESERVSERVRLKRIEMRGWLCELKGNEDLEILGFITLYIYIYIYEDILVII